MLASERLLEIEAKFAATVERIVPLELDGETLSVILYLKDSTNLRVAEQWAGRVLKRYSYYWLNSANELKVGWDNAPHHTQLESFPHHKHIKSLQRNMQPSTENRLEEVMSMFRSKRRYSSGKISEVISGEAVFAQQAQILFYLVNIYIFPT